MNKRILIAEDDQSIRDITSEYLKELGYDVITAVDGQDALDKVELELFDLYLLDIYMPRMDGLELMMRIKEIQPLAVIIVITGYSSLDVAVKALKTGAFHYLTKPINGEELARAVEAGMKHSAQQEELGGISPAAQEISQELIDLLLLKGFTTEQRSDFQQIGTLVQYRPDEKIPLNDQYGSMIWVESGRISVQLSGTHVDTLRPGDLWGEETFIGANSVFTDLVVQTEAQVRHFSRKKMMEFFTYQDESLIKRFMINLIQCLYFKWRKAVIKIGLYSGYSPQTNNKG
ncbi:MAG: response regulator [Candidatus Cloacimonetes bacterium]|nr:response regulator [Candidatus Cloacimonadota bacterium]